MSPGNLGSVDKLHRGILLEPVPSCFTIDKHLRSASCFSAAEVRRPVVVHVLPFRGHKCGQLLGVVLANVENVTLTILEPCKQHPLPEK
jgi:hypothetical protein